MSTAAPISSPDLPALFRKATMSCIAVVNAGSSSLKFAVYQSAPDPLLLLKGQIEGIGAKPRASLSDAQGETLAAGGTPEEGFDHAAATRTMMRIRRRGSRGEISPRSGTASFMGAPTIRRRCS